MAGERKSPEYHYYIAKIVSYDDPIRCDNCPIMESYSRKQCKLTAEYIGDSRRIGYICPLIPVTMAKFFAIEDMIKMEDQGSDE